MLGQALRLIRTFHDLKQGETAEKLGISKSYLSEIEGGSKTPTLQLVETYASVFEIPASSILFFAENIERRGSYDEARRIVASKIIAMLQLLDARSKSPSHEA